jgi:glycosyltransferase involved in cell wall biosynthesis
MNTRLQGTDCWLRLCRVVTVPVTFSTLLRHQLKAIADNGISVTLVSSPGEDLDFVCQQYAMPCYPVEMSRQIALFQDVKSLVRLLRLFRSERFDIVHSSTPKAGLLTAIAGWLARIPIRLHTYTGQPWVELHGPLRWVARWADRLIGLLNTHCYADSNSQRKFLIDEGLIQASRISVLASGSISGVDLVRFDPHAWSGEKTLPTRRRLHIAEDALVVLFVGRLTRDKGVVELISAFHSLDLSGKNIELVLVGPFEPDRDPLPPSVLDELSSDPKIHVVGFTRQPEEYMGIADVFCLPSYREGFGSVVIEAAAMGVPAVATSVVGLIDAVVPGKTGLLVPPKDCQALRDALAMLLDDPGLRSRLGQAARVRAQRMFDAAVVDQAVVDEYKRTHAQHCERRWHAGNV